MKDTNNFNEEIYIIISDVTFSILKKGGFSFMAGCDYIREMLMKLKIDVISHFLTEIVNSIKEFLSFGYNKTLEIVSLYFENREYAKYSSIIYTLVNDFGYFYNNNINLN